MNNGYKHYLKNQVTTSNPQQLTVLLIEKCINNVKVAQKKIEEKEFNEVHNRLVNTEQIMIELIRSLNREIKDDVIENLDSLYEWVLVESQKMNSKKDPVVGDKIIQVLNKIKEGFKGEE